MHHLYTVADISFTLSNFETSEDSQNVEVCATTAELLEREIVVSINTMDDSAIG